MPTSALRTNCTVERCTSRTTSSTRAAATLTTRAVGRSWVVIQSTVKTMRGDRGLDHARGGRRAPWTSWARTTCSTVSTSAVAGSRRSSRCCSVGHRQQLVARVEHEPGAVVRADPAGDPHRPARARSRRSAGGRARSRVSTAEPSYSSASRAGTPPRGRSVTVRSTPRTVTGCRSGASPMETLAGVALVAPQLLGVHLRAAGRPAAAGCAAAALRRPCQASWRGPGAGRVRRSPGAPASGSTIGSGSPTGIAWSPRRTTTWGAPPPTGSAVSGSTRRLAEEGRAQHPAGPVDADDPRRLLAGPAVGRLHGEPARPARGRSCPPARSRCRRGGPCRRRAGAGSRSTGRRCGARRTRAAPGRRRGRRASPPAPAGCARRPGSAARARRPAGSAASRGRPARRRRRRASVGVVGARRCGLRARVVRRRPSSAPSARRGPPRRVGRDLRPNFTDSSDRAGQARPNPPVEP